VRTVNLRVCGQDRSVQLRTNPSDTFTFAEILLRKGYESMLEGLRRPATTWVDIGAHVGLATLYASAACPGMRGICLEPVAESAALLRRNIANNGLPFTVVEAAVGDGGAARLFKTGWWSSCTTQPEVAALRLGNIRRPEHTHALQSELVPTITIGTLLDTCDLDTVDLMKIDAEGAEAVLFATPEPWMRRVGRICLDLHARYVETARVERVLTEVGFRRIATGPGRLAVFDREAAR
jgi:FkbM family methyltransferase